jgi:hypothetical protein
MCFREAHVHTKYDLNLDSKWFHIFFASVKVIELQQGTLETGGLKNGPKKESAAKEIIKT